MALFSCYIDIIFLVEIFPLAGACAVCKVEEEPRVSPGSESSSTAKKG